MKQLIYLRENSLVLNLQNISSIEYINYDLRVTTFTGSDNTYQGITQEDVQKLTNAWEVFQTETDYVLTGYEINKITQAAMTVEDDEELNTIIQRVRERTIEPVQASSSDI